MKNIRFNFLNEEKKDDPKLIDDIGELKDYAEKVLKNAFGEKYDKEKAMKMVDDLIKKHGKDEDGSYGTVVGVIQNSLDEGKNLFENLNEAKSVIELDKDGYAFKLLKMIKKEGDEDNPMSTEKNGWLTYDISVKLCKELEESPKYIANCDFIAKIEGIHKLIKGIFELIGQDIYTVGNYGYTFDEKISKEGDKNKYQNRIINNLDECNLHCIQKILKSLIDIYTFFIKSMFDKGLYNNNIYTFYKSWDDTFRQAIRRIGILSESKSKERLLDKRLFESYFGMVMNRPNDTPPLTTMVINDDSYFALCIAREVFHTMVSISKIDTFTHLGEYMESCLETLDNLKDSIEPNSPTYLETANYFQYMKTNKLKYATMILGILVNFMVQVSKKMELKEEYKEVKLQFDLYIKKVSKTLQYLSNFIG